MRTMNRRAVHMRAVNGVLEITTDTGIAVG